jgi:hypothetical protein
MSKWDFLGKRASAISLAGLAVALLVLGAGCHQALPVFGAQAEGQLTQKFYVKASSDGNSAVVTTDPEFSAGAGVILKSAPTAGAQDSLDYIQNKISAPVSIPMQGTLSRTYWLDLAKYVQGTIYISNVISQTASAGGKGIESGRLRIEFYHADKRAGGYEFETSAAVTADTKSTPWIPIHFRFRPEVAALEEGKTFSLKLTRISGLADFRVGTNAGQQSFAEIHYYDKDPLAGAVYVEKNLLLTAEPTESASSSGDSSLLVAGGALLPLIGLLALPTGRDRRRALLAGALMLALAFSGCLSSDGDKKVEEHTTGPAPRFDENQRKNDTLKEQGVGALEGFIKDDIGFAIKGAHVSILGTSLATQSSTDGFYRFKEIQAKSYTLRIDATGFVSVERNILIEIGIVKILNVTMVPPVTTSSNDRDHKHDLWAIGETKRDILDFKFNPDSCANAWLSTCQKTPSGNQWICQEHNGACFTNINFDPQKIILPGTSLVEVKLIWNPGTTGVKELILAGKNPGWTAGHKDDAEYRFSARGPNDPYRLAIFPNEADSGHQEFTRWTWTLYVPAVDAYTLVGPPIYMTGEIQMLVTIHKGVVPYEPKHRDFWEGTNRMVVMTEQLKKGAAGKDYPDFAADTSKFTPVKGAFIPPGTMAVEGYLRWTHSQNDALSFTDWKLVYKPANYPPSYPAAKPATMGDVSGKNRTVTIVPLAEEVDKFYQTASFWEFYIDDGTTQGLPGTATVNSGYGTSWYLTLVAIKDPTWKDV